MSGQRCFHCERDIGYEIDARLGAMERGRRFKLDRAITQVGKLKDPAGMMLLLLDVIGDEALTRAVRGRIAALAKGG